jgi:hypothetical protein
MERRIVFFSSGIKAVIFWIAFGVNRETLFSLSPQLISKILNKKQAKKERK